VTRAGPRGIGDLCLRQVTIKDAFGYFHAHHISLHLDGIGACEYTAMDRDDPDSRERSSSFFHLFAHSHNVIEHPVHEGSCSARFVATRYYCGHTILLYCNDAARLNSRQNKIKYKGTATRHRPVSPLIPLHFSREGCVRHGSSAVIL